MIRFAQVAKSTLKSVATSLRCCVLEVRDYGTMYCLIGDKSSFNPWECNPLITFAAEDSTAVFPVTPVFETRHFFGSAAVPQEKKIIINHFQYGASSTASIKFSIFDVAEDFSCQLGKEICINAGNVAGSCLDGRFVSPEVGTYISVWGDLTNNTLFTVGDCKLTDGVVQTVDIEAEALPLGFRYLSDVYFANVNTVYTSCALSAGPAHPNHLVLQVYCSGASYLGNLTMPFHRVIILPFQIIPPTKRTYDSSVQQYKIVVDDDGLSERFLVRVRVKQASAAAESSVTFLLKTPTSEVLDMCIDGGEDACCIGVDNRTIVHVVHTHGKATFAEVINTKAFDLIQSHKSGSTENLTTIEEGTQEEDR